MATSFPGDGHRCDASFRILRIDRDVTLGTSLHCRDPDENGERLGQETVAIRAEPMSKGIFPHPSFAQHHGMRGPQP